MSLVRVVVDVVDAADTRCSGFCCLRAAQQQCLLPKHFFANGGDSPSFVNLEVRFSPRLLLREKSNKYVSNTFLLVSLVVFQHDARDNVRRDNDNPRSEIDNFRRDNDNVRSERDNPRSDCTSRTESAMSLRGKRLLETARRQRDSRISAFLQHSQHVVDGSRALEVVLSPSVAGVQRVPEWNELAVEQGLVEEAALRNATDGAYFALQDRNTFAEDWRAVYVVRDGDAFVLYDSKGLLLNEKSAGVAEGRHAVEELLNEFVDPDMRYYRSPKIVRSSPVRHRGEACRQVEAVQTVELQDTPTPSLLDQVVVVSTQNGDGDPAIASNAARVSENEQPAVHSPTPLQEESGNEPPEVVDPPSPQVVGIDQPEADAGEHVSDGENLDESTETEHAAPTIDRPIEEPVPSMLTVGTRVSISFSDGEVGGGMVAATGLLSLLVAMDDGNWHNIDNDDVRSKVVEDISEPSDTFSGVAGFAYDQTNKNVSGMLLGCDEMPLLGGQMYAYCSHIARQPIENRDPRLRGRERPEELSFSLGDRVRQLGDPSRPKSFATVVRVMYSRRRGKVQARRYLVLVELDEKMQLTFSDSSPPMFFPASWMNWTQVDDASTLEVSDIQRVDEVSAFEPEF